MCRARQTPRRLLFQSTVFRESQSSDSSSCGWVFEFAFLLQQVMTPINLEVPKQREREQNATDDVASANEKRFQPVLWTK